MLKNNWHEIGRVDAETALKLGTSGSPPDHFANVHKLLGHNRNEYLTGFQETIEAAEKTDSMGPFYGTPTNNP